MSRSMFAELAFTDAVRGVQEKMGSRGFYAKEEGAPAEEARFGEAETAFIHARDSFYMATVSETGWPYVQYRGGPAGFVRVLDDKTLGLPDFRGNKQYVSVGNLAGDDRISIIFMDYPNKRRLKLLGHVSVIDPDDSETLESLRLPDYRAKVERGFLIRAEAMDWNCPQHITERYTEAHIAEAILPLHQRIEELEAQLAAR
ncbi:MAG: pyridoxamine 5'-phosphate oxidase family protein [Alphaproteobacteria bacterium]|jgi:uncharacterized protein|nr:pyridoxamine 5-phosphate oxidase [Rhodospirillaceae bacterium]MBT7615598.1 pyridoxamine 5-phosphate oxidase [Rhodospirillaceae bacterium]MDG2482861.1 pyridoxamine 5'-phosphate oxidase family protein [Alphaproteobacteria bacterium]